VIYAGCKYSPVFFHLGCKYSPIFFDVGCNYSPHPWQRTWDIITSMSTGRGLRMSIGTGMEAGGAFERGSTSGRLRLTPVFLALTVGT
jgi:hypothetical protein